MSDKQHKKTYRRQKAMAKEKSWNKIQGVPKREKQRLAREHYQPTDDFTDSDERDW